MSYGLLSLRQYFHVSVLVYRNFSRSGVVGVAVGFGAQTIVKDIITGFFIIFEGQFDVSDYVQINASGVTILKVRLKRLV